MLFAAIRCSAFSCSSSSAVASPRGALAGRWCDGGLRGSVDAERCGPTIRALHLRQR